MKKIAKLSLVAAVAVVGLTSANAQALEEAIKNVDTSGSVVYRYNDSNNDKDTKKNSSATNNNYKVALNLSSKVNEDVKFNSRFLAANSNGSFAGKADDKGLSSQDDGDGNVDLSLSHAYFGYTGLANTTVNVGKQGLTTPWTVAIDSDGNEQTGTGVLAMTTVGPVTFAAAYFNQTNLNNSGQANGSINNVKITNGSDDIATVGAIATLDAVTLDAWYNNIDDTLDSYTIGANSKLELNGVDLGIDARYVSLELDKRLDSAENKNELAKLALTAKAGIVSGKVAYAWTGKDGGLTALDNDAQTTLLGWNLNANGKADADYWQAVVGVDILANLNLSANYGNIEYIQGTVDVEEEEIYAQLTYKMSKNLSTYARYGVYTKDTNNISISEVDSNTGRLQVEYTF